jgi:hypothetical protein
MSTTPFNAAQVIIPEQQDNSITAAVAIVTINQNTNKDWGHLQKGANSIEHTSYVI